MSYNRGSNFDTEHWYRERIKQRTKDALEQQDEEFIAENEDAPDSVLLDAVRSRARELGYTPYPVEVTGGALIIRRFGSWDRALTMARLPLPHGAHKLTDSRRYKDEYARQQKLHRAEKKAKKEARLRRMRELNQVKKN